MNDKLIPGSLITLNMDFDAFEPRTFKYAGFVLDRGACVLVLNDGADEAHDELDHIVRQDFEGGSVTVISTVGVVVLRKRHVLADCFVTKHV